jgi:phytoene dehydrogenase-like protein
LKASKFVATTLNPQQTFLELIGGDKIDPHLKERAENFKYSPVTPVYTIHLALDEQPLWVAAEWEPQAKDAWLIIMGVESTEDVKVLEADCRAGRFPSRLQLFGGVPTVFDPWQAPKGKHAAWFWQVAPYNLKDGGPDRWDDIIDEVTEKETELITEFAPNINKDTIVHSFGLSPVDIERHFPNMREGDWMCGELNPDQFLYNRPFPECSQYRTPIEGLYIAGSCCHPGGNITGAPGYNAAKIIVEDLGLERWWTPPDLEKIWGGLE